MVATTPAQDEFEAVEDNLRAALGIFSVVRETGELRELPGVSIISSGLTYPMFNAAFHMKSAAAAGEDLERRIALAKVHFRARGLRWCYWLCRDRLDSGVLRRTREVFGNHGMHLAMASPGMVSDQLPPVERPLAALDCRRVGDEQTRLGFAHIMSVAFGIPFAVAVEIYAGQNIWQTGFMGYVGYLDGNPVSTTAVMIAAGVIGIYAVGTLPGHQRRGYAEATMRHAVEQARKMSGIERTILQSSQAGLPLYVKLGYRSVTEFQVFVSPA